MVGCSTALYSHGLHALMFSTYFPNIRLVLLPTFSFEFSIESGGLQEGAISRIYSLCVKSACANLDSKLVTSCVSRRLKQ